MRWKGSLCRSSLHLSDFLKRKPELVLGVGRWTTWMEDGSGQEIPSKGHASRRGNLDHCADASSSCSSPSQYPTMADEVVLPIPNLTIPQNLFVLSNPALKHLHDNARKDLLEGIKADRTHSFIYIPGFRY